MHRVDALRNTVIPHGVEVAETRNYGATADDKAQKLIHKLLFATASVVALVFVALGWREAAIVGSAVILTLTVTLFASWAWGFTLNRVSLFALIFSIGILVDDAIVVVENIHRHRALQPGKTLAELIPGAVDEVGGPTILATLTVIAALLPIAFVPRADRSLHEPDPDQREHGHVAVARHRLRGHAVARAPVDGRCARVAPRPGAARPGRTSRPAVRARVPPAARRSPGRAQPRAARRRRRAADRRLAGAAGARPGRAQDAAVRQQVGVPGDRRHARRHAGGEDRRGAARARRLSGPAARSDRLPGVCRHRRADQLQRPGAPVPPALRRRGRRPAGEPRRQACAQRTEPCHREAAAPRAADDRAALRCERQGGRGAARSAGAGADRRRGLRPRGGRPPPGREGAARGSRGDPGHRRRR